MDRWTPTGGLATLAGAGLIGGPLLMLLSDGAAAAGIAQPYWTVPFWLSFFLFLVAVAGLTALSGFTRTSVWGGLLASAGCLMGTTIIGLERMAWSVRNQGIGDDVVAAALMDPVVFLTSRAPGLAFPIGLVLLAVAARRAGVLSRPAAVVLAVGALLFPAGRIVFGPAVNTVGDALTLAALAPLGWSLIRGPGGAGSA